MSSIPTQTDDDGDWVNIIRREKPYEFGKLFAVVHAVLRFRRFDGRMSEPIERINFERGDSVSVLLYDPDEDAVVLVRQFRYPVFDGLDATAQAGEGARKAWLLEAVAGVVDGGRTAKEVAHKELLEEAGYVMTGDLQFITAIYPSPGGSSERIHLYLGEVDHRRRDAPGGGVAAEGEDIQIVVLPFAEAMAMVAHGEINDAKTIVALQHMALRKTARSG
jgi:ADP-ribose pyrophosphatase